MVVFGLESVIPEIDFVNLLNLKSPPVNTAEMHEMGCLLMSLPTRNEPVYRPREQKYQYQNQLTSLLGCYFADTFNRCDTCT